MFLTINLPDILQQPEQKKRRPANEKNKAKKLENNARIKDQQTQLP